MPWTLALLFPLAAWVLPVPWGALGSCCACILDVPPALGTALSLPPWPALLLALLWACPQILLELGLLEQTSHSCCLWQLFYAQLYSPALHVLSRPWALVFGSGLSVFGAQLQAVGQGSCGGTAQERLWFALGITWEKLPGMSKGIIRLGHVRDEGT